MVATIKFNGTAEQEQQLKAVMAQLKADEGSVMQALQHAQDIYGYLPKEVQKMVAEGMDATLAEVYGVATFYSQFTLFPKGENKISICLGTACYVKGSGKVFEKLESLLGIKGGECTADGKFSLDACRCIGACGLAPVMMINGDVYGRLTEDQLEGIIAKYK